MISRTFCPCRNPLISDEIGIQTRTIIERTSIHHQLPVASIHKTLSDLLTIEMCSVSSSISLQSVLRCCGNGGEPLPA